MVSNRFTNSSDPEHVKSRIFIGNLDCEKINDEELEKIYSKFGNVIGVSMHRSFAFVQFDSESSAKAAAAGTHQTLLSGKKVDVNVASDRRKNLPSGNRQTTINPAGPQMHPSGGPQSRMRGPSRFADGFAPYSNPPSERGPGGSAGNRSAPYYVPNYESSHQPDYMGGHPGSLPSRHPSSNPPPMGHESWPQQGYPQHAAPQSGAPQPGGSLLPQRGGPGPQYQYPDASSAMPISRLPERDCYPPQAAASSRPPVRCPIDCEIISTNNKFNHYADYICSQLVSRSMKCNTNIQYNESLLPVLKNRALATGVPFCILLENAGDMIPSVTLCLYFASPEEHRNMTIEAALELLYNHAVRYGIGSSGAPQAQNAPPSHPSSVNGAPSNPTFPSAASMGGQLPHQQPKYTPNVSGDNRDIRQQPPPQPYGGNLLHR